MITTMRGGPRGMRVEAPKADRIPTVPDHVPPHVAAEHPDAAAVVAGPSADRTPRAGVRVVGRGEERPIWVLRIVALVACAALAAVTSSSERSGAGALTLAEAAAPTAPALISAPTTAEPTECVLGTPLRCEPPCPAQRLLDWSWEPCPQSDTTRRT